MEAVSTHLRSIWGPRNARTRSMVLLVGHRRRLSSSPLHLHRLIFLWFRESPSATVIERFLTLLTCQQIVMNLRSFALGSRRPGRGGARRLLEIDSLVVNFLLLSSSAADLSIPLIGGLRISYKASNASCLD